MKTNVKVDVFDTPSGNVRGLVNEFAAIRGKDQRRIAHATLLVNGDPDISIEVPKRLSAEEVTIVANGLLEFMGHLQGLSEMGRNDISAMIAAEEALISAAGSRIAKLKEQLGPVMTLIGEGDKKYGLMLMTVEEFYREEDAGCLTSDDGDGVWATATHKSDVRTSKPKPDWATHVVWVNR